MLLIMMPLIFQIIVIIEIERCMFHRMKWIFVLMWYLFGIVIECFLLFVLFGKFSEIVCKNLDSKTIFFQSFYICC